MIYFRNSSKNNLCEFCLCYSRQLDCPLSKGNHAPRTKYERPNKKMSKSIFFYIGQELVRPAHLKAQWSDFFNDLNRIKTNENQWRLWSFYIWSIFQSYIKWKFSFISSVSAQIAGSKIILFQSNLIFLVSCLGT